MKTRHSSPELADVFAMHAMQYRLDHKLPVQHLDTLFAIESCRKPILGGHINKCDNCGHEVVTYNSCRNRHCPKCQTLDRLKWVDKLSVNLLPVRHFHIVFTIPCELNRLVLVNQKCLYDILFRAASQSLLTLAKDHQHLGAQTGMIAVLHTWGQNLMDHPHLHTIVPAGGWSEMNQYWKSSRRKFFIPVKVISALFKGKFLAMLKDAYIDGDLKFEGEIKPLKQKKSFQALLDLLYDEKKKWVVYTNPSFKNSTHVVNYLGRYTHRVALSNDRIINVDKESVTFKWKDYKDQGRQKIMKLPAPEFIRRFLLHVLPQAFCKIRYYGLYAARNQQSGLAKCRKALGIVKAKAKLQGLSWQEILIKIAGNNVFACPVCQKGHMVIDKLIKGGYPLTPS